MAAAREYYHIVAWGQSSGSLMHFIRHQQQIAAAAGAPVNAIYQRDNGAWATVNDIALPELRRLIDGLAGELREVSE